jgi:hypothetical protein
MIIMKFVLYVGDVSKMGQYFAKAQHLGFVQQKKPNVARLLEILLLEQAQIWIYLLPGTSPSRQNDAVLRQSP